jgi:hypothetical protein
LFTIFIVTKRQKAGSLNQWNQPICLPFNLSKFLANVHFSAFLNINSYCESCSASLKMLCFIARIKARGLQTVSQAISDWWTQWTVTADKSHYCSISGMAVQVECMFCSCLCHGRANQLINAVNTLWVSEVHKYEQNNFQWCHIMPYIKIKNLYCSNTCLIINTQ